MGTVAELISSKKNPSVHTIGPAATMYDAVKLMALKQVGALLVVVDDRLLGIVTERDYARKIALQSRASHTTSVESVMSTPVVTVTPADSTEQCLVLMAQHQFRHLPVLEGDSVVGMVSIRDLVDELIADRRVLIDDIEHAVEARPHAHH